MVSLAHDDYRNKFRSYLLRNDQILSVFMSNWEAQSFYKGKSVQTWILRSIRSIFWVDKVLSLYASQSFSFWDIKEALQQFCCLWDLWDLLLAWIHNLLLLLLPNGCDPPWSTEQFPSIFFFLQGGQVNCRVISGEELGSAKQSFLHASVMTLHRNPSIRTSWSACLCGSAQQVGKIL